MDADWEVPATINETWGFKTHDHSWKSPTDLIRKLVDVTSKGGNYLLNVGPTAEGIIPQPSLDRLLVMGDWLRRNGEALYGTRPGPVQGVEWCRSTQRPGKVYLHVFDWPVDGQLSVPGFTGAITQASLLAGGETLDAQPTRGATVLTGPSSAPDPFDTVIVLETGEVTEVQQPGDDDE